MAGGDENSTKWSLDLDIKDALESVEKFHGALDQVGEVESFSSLMETATHLGVAIGGVGLALFSVKEAFDLVLEAEQIRAIDQQFELLSEHAGIAAQELKKSMQEASGGLMAEDDLLKAANRGLVELGQNATHMGDLMAVARQSTLVMGGDLKNNFENIVQAIATGRTRALAGMGIIVDQNKAFKDYAATLGITADELSKAGQQHALLNAVLEKAKTSFSGVNGDVLEATNSWAQFKATLKDVGDIATLAFDKIAGPAVRAEVGGMSAIAKDAKHWFTDMFGEGAAQAAAHTERLQEKIRDIKGELIDLEQKKLGHVFDPAPADTLSRMQALQVKLKDLEGEDQKLTAQRSLANEKEKEQTKELAAVNKTSEIDEDARNKKQQKFLEQMAKLREQELADRLRVAQSEEQVREIYAQKAKILQEAELADEKKINIEFGKDTEQSDKLITQSRANLAAKIKTLADQQKKSEIQALQEYQKNATNIFDGVQRAALVASKQMTKDLTDWGKQGEMVTKTLSSNLTNAFKQMGEGSKGAAEAMKDAMLGAIGQIAEQEGSMIILKGVADTVMLNPMGPPEIAAGGALVALGGYLQSLAGGGGGGGAASSSGGGGAAASMGGGGGGASQDTSSASPNSLSQTPQKSVSLTIHGNYYDSNETKMQLMGMIREATDATDFNYYKVGGK